MTTESYLAQLGATIETAKNFIMSNVAEPRIIYDICKTFSVNNDMIAEVLQSEFPGLTGQGVSDFFDANGFNGKELGFSSTPIEEDNTLNTYDINTILGKTFYTMDQEEGTFDIDAPINAFTASAFNESLQNDKTFNLINDSWVLDTSGVDPLSIISNVTVNNNTSYTITSGYGVVEVSIEEVNDNYWTMQADTAYGTFYEDMYLAPNDYILSHSGAETFIA